MRFFAKISYDGTYYAGWQTQPNSVTVQSVLERSLGVLHGLETVAIVGCGRTDAGVHAKDYVLHFDLEEEKYDLEQLAYKWDKILPADISVSTVAHVSEERHARFDAISRSYSYQLHTRKDPFRGNFSTFYAAAKDIDTIELGRVASLIATYEDQATFCKSKTDVKTTLCTITESKWTRMDDGGLTYTISANRFLRGMVRLIVGTSINVALGKLSLDDLAYHLKHKTKPDYHYSAPPQGLRLERIQYPYEF